MSLLAGCNRIMSPFRENRLIVMRPDLSPTTWLRPTSASTIKDHLELTERYNPAAAALRDAQRLVEEACGTVKGLPRGAT